MILSKGWKFRGYIIQPSEMGKCYYRDLLDEHFEKKSVDTLEICKIDPLEGLESTHH